jgi:hypothetical protein
MCPEFTKKKESKTKHPTSRPPRQQEEQKVRLLQ